MCLTYTISYSFSIGVSMKCRKKIYEEQIKLQKCDISIWNPFRKIMCVTILFMTPISVGQSLEQGFCISNFLSEWKQTNTGSNTEITKFFRTPFLKLICQSALKLNFFMILKINLLLIKFSLVSEKDNTESCGYHSNSRYKRDSRKMAVQYTVW